MNRLKNEQRLKIFEFYYQSACSVKKVHRALLSFYGQFNWPTEAAIRAIVHKFLTKFTLFDIKPPTRSRRAGTEENIALYQPVSMMTINYRIVIGERYREILSNFFCPKCKSFTCMTCGFNKMVPLAGSTLNNELIERRIRWTFYFTFGTSQLAPWLGNLPPLDNFLWG